MIKNCMSAEPFLLKPAGKDYLWGGERLKSEFGKELDLSPLAETWECSTHPDGPSCVAGGDFDGMTLTEVLSRHPEYLGTRHAGETVLPILIKFIDAKRDLSVQVHPDDAYAAQHEHGQRGKTEMWYVLDAEKDARLVYGLRWDTEAETLRRGIENGTVGKYLQTMPVKADDVFYMEAGTIHALGAGCLVAEIQENSNLTYRLYDYDRVDKNGQKRPLHIEKALAAANLHSSAAPRQPMRVLRYRQGAAQELLCRCQYFEVHRLLVNGSAAYGADALAFRVLLCIGGAGMILWDGGSIPVRKGDCVFYPAASEDTHLQGKLQFLDVRG